MSEIADFLRARYAERRAIAEAAAALQDDPENGWGIADSSGYAQTEKRRWISPHIGMIHEAEAAEHVVANNPTAIIADLDAKLAIVDLHAPVELVGVGDLMDACAVCEVTGMYPEYPCKTLRILAQPFAGHADHKGEEWAP